jgi:hypothetical protein
MLIDRRLHGTDQKEAWDGRRDVRAVKHLLRRNGRSSSGTQKIGAIFGGEMKYAPVLCSS